METINTLIPSREFGTTLKDASDADYRRIRDNYDNLIGKPLELWQIIPCTEAGEVLEEPEMYMDLQNVGSMNSHATEQDCIDAENYHRAKSRCLFEGFELLPAQSNEGGVIILNRYNNKTLLFIYGNIATYDVNTIEDSIYMQLTLTQTAKELIYGTSR